MVDMNRAFSHHPSWSLELGQVCQDGPWRSEAVTLLLVTSMLELLKRPDQCNFLLLMEVRTMDRYTMLFGFPSAGSHVHDALLPLLTVYYRVWIVHRKESQNKHVKSTVVALDAAPTDDLWRNGNGNGNHHTKT